MLELWPLLIVFVGFAIVFASFLYTRNPHRPLIDEEKRDKAKILVALEREEGGL